MKTFDLEKEIMIVSETVATKEQLLDCYMDLGRRYVEAEIQKQALKEAVAEVVSEEQAVDISTRMSEKIDNHIWRNTTQEARELLYDYGYKKPVVPITQEEAESFFNRGGVVFLLERDNTERIAKDLKDIQLHYENGGIAANTQLDVDIEIDWMLNEHEEEDYDLE